MKLVPFFLQVSETALLRCEFAATPPAITTVLLCVVCIADVNFLQIPSQTEEVKAAAISALTSSGRFSVLRFCFSL